MYRIISVTALTTPNYIVFITNPLKKTRYYFHTDECLYNQPFKYPK